jgi:hypothetical protein
MTWTRWQFDSREPLKFGVRNPAIDQNLGVAVSRPYANAGLDGEVVVDLYGETINFATRAFGQCVPERDWRRGVREVHGQIIADLDRMIAELQAHRDRLADSAHGLVDEREVSDR